MLNKLTIRKQSDLNDLIKIVNNFILSDGNITYFNYKDSSCKNESYNNSTYFIKGLYQDIQVIFYMENDDEIVMETNLDIENAYKLYRIIVKP